MKWQKIFTKNVRSSSASPLLLSSQRQLLEVTCTNCDPRSSLRGTSTSGARMEGQGERRQGPSFLSPWIRWVAWRQDLRTGTEGPAALRFLELGHRQEGSLAEKVRFLNWQDGRTGLGGCLTFGCDRLVGRPHGQDGGTGGEAECASGLNFNGVQYRLEAGHTQARRTRPEEKSQQTT